MFTDKCTREHTLRLLIVLNKPLSCGQAIITQKTMFLEKTDTRLKSLERAVRVQCVCLTGRERGIQREAESVHE